MRGVSLCMSKRLDYRDRASVQGRPQTFVGGRAMRISYYISAVQITFESKLRLMFQTFFSSHSENVSRYLYFLFHKNLLFETL